MILTFDKKGELVGMMKSLPKKNEYMGIRTHDIRRAIAGDRKTAGNLQWKEVIAENLEK